MEEFKKLKCFVCEKEVMFVIPLEIAGDHPFFRNYGVCFECFKKINLDENIMLKSCEYIKEQLENARERVDYWEKELKDITKTDI